MAECKIIPTAACEQCGDSFLKTQPRKRFCSTVCQRIGENARTASKRNAVCIGCGATFHPKRSNRLKFCSRECAFQTKTALAAGPKPYERKPLTMRACAQCGALFEARLGSLCSAACRKERGRQAALEYARVADVRDRSPRACRECAVVFVPVYGMKRRSFCSQDCCDRSGNRTARLKRKARKRAATVESVNPTRVFERDGWLCHLCGTKTDKAKRGTYHPKAPELDHIVPLSKGGAHSYANTACAHRKCNADKSDKIIGQPSLLAA